jgi:hypothetical protein
VIIKKNNRPAAKSERRLIVQILFLLPLMALLLRILGFKRSYVGLNHLVSPVGNSPKVSKMALSISRNIVKIVNLVNRNYIPYRFSCLPESLTLWFLLRRRNIPAELRLGVRTITGPFESHAWVEYNQVALNDIENIAKIYAPFDLSTITTK